MKDRLVSLSFLSTKNFPSEFASMGQKTAGKQQGPELENFFQALSVGHGMVVQRVELVNTISLLRQSLLF